MKKFLDEDFLLKNETAHRLYFEAAKDQPIIDFHNHLVPQEIYEDLCYDNLSEVWLDHDHYKWRAMRAHGISERLITGDADSYDKFLAWADTVQNCIGNPLYHWTHLELLRYFDIHDTLDTKSAKKIWDEANAKLKTRDYSVRNLIRKMGVKVLCTTDDPADDLIWHQKLAGEDMGFRVYPSFRPEKAIGIEKAGFSEYIKKLSDVSGVEINEASDVLKALVNRLDFFVNTAGCRVSDHSLENSFYIPATYEEVDEVFKKKMSGEATDERENAKYHGYLLKELGREYKKRNLVMQLHIGAIRNNSERMYEKLGPDAGFDSVNDFNYAPELSELLNAMDKTDDLPKTILYCLNEKDLYMLGTMAGNFFANEDGIRGKVQLGSAWWFLDHKNGMEKQLSVLSDVGLLSAFVGMLTDSRSFLSFSRHEYFRRILCNKIGTWVEDGEYPADMDFLLKITKDICSDNAIKYFGFNI